MSARARVELDRAWQAIVALVMDGRDEWKRKVTDATGVRFSSVRALRRLDARPLTLKELADALGTDAPAATVIVNDLEERGLVQRRSHPADRRAKLVSLTAAGKRTLAAARSVTEHAPPALVSLSDDDVATLTRIFGPLAPPKR